MTDRLYLSMFLGVYGFVIALGLGVSLGVLSAFARLGARPQRRGLAVIGVSAPVFATGILLLYVFGVVLGWFPVFGRGKVSPTRSST